MAKKKQLIRTDIHRPSAIEPKDYQFVAFSVREWRYTYSPDANGIYLIERTLLRNHMETTKGSWSSHQHGGSCHICGAHAIYLATYYHKDTNSYICTGMDCAEKMEMQDAARFKRFRDGVDRAQKWKTGWKRAERILCERTPSLKHVWDVYLQTEIPTAHTIEQSLKKAGMEDGPDRELARLALRDMFLEEGLDPDLQPVPWGREESIIRDIIGKVIQYGSLTPKQGVYLNKLTEDINKRPERLAKQADRDRARAEEKAKADPAPTGRCEVEVEVIKTDTKYYEGGVGGSREVMTVKAVGGDHGIGWVAWGSVPSNCTVERGTKLVIRATFTVKEEDPKFAFFLRPTFVRYTHQPSPNQVS